MLFQNKFTDVSGIDSDSWKNQTAPTRQTREHASTSWTNQSSSRRLFVFRLVSCQAKFRRHPCWSSVYARVSKCVWSRKGLSLINQNQIKYISLVDWVCKTWCNKKEYASTLRSQTANAFSFLFCLLCLDWIGLNPALIYSQSVKIGLNTCADRRMIRLIEKIF